MRCVPAVDLGRAGMSRTRAAAATHGAGDATGDGLLVEQPREATTDGLQVQHQRGSRVSTLAKYFDKKHHARWSVATFGAADASTARVYGNIVGGSAGAQH